MELRQLEHFLVLARTLSFTKAAAELFVVQSALSQQIARLEAELGVQLFDRTSRRVVLTEAGDVLRMRAEVLVRMAHDAQAEIGELAGAVRGSLRLGVSRGVDGVVELAGLLARFRSAFPAVRLVIRDNRAPKMIANLVDGELDVAFIAGETQGLPAGLSGIELAKERLVAVVDPAHPLAGRQMASLRELAEAGPLLDPSPDTRLRAIVDAAWAAAGVRRTTTMEVVEVYQLARYAASGLGAALVSTSGLRHVAPPEGQDGFTTVELRDRIEYSVTCAYRSPGPSAPAAREFLTLLAEVGIGGEAARSALRHAAVSRQRPRL